MALAGPVAGNASPASAYKVGTMARRIAPTGPFDWRGSREHTLKVTVWYPAQPSVKEVALEVPPAAPLWQAGMAAPEAPPAAPPKGFPLIVLSHGTGGAGIQLAWLGTALARRGFVAAAVNHPGNNDEEPSTLEGFTLRWLRARDLSAVIDGLLADKDLGRLIDPKRIGAAGFSLGGFAVMTIAGARSDIPGFLRYCAGHREACVPPPELANVNQEIEAKARADASFRAGSRACGRIVS